LSASVDGLRVAGNADFIAGTDVASLAALDHNGTVPDRRIAGAVDQRRALNHDDRTRLLRRRENENRSQKHTDEDRANLPRIHVCLPREGFEFPFVPQTET